MRYLNYFFFKEMRYLIKIQEYVFIQFKKYQYYQHFKPMVTYKRYVS